MVEIKPKLLVLTIFIDVFIFVMFMTMPDALAQNFLTNKTYNEGMGGYDSIDDDYLNGTEISQTQFLSSSWTGLWGFIKFMLYGVLFVSGLPVYLSLSVYVFFWALNIFVLAEIIGYVREFIGFT